MQIIPAIDIRNGKCVRLFQGDYAKETIYADSPVDMALKWKKQGAKKLHIVDLDGAKNGELINFEVIKNIISETRLPVQIGGGIRNIASIKRLIEVGVSKIVLGTIVVEDKALLRTVINEYPKKIIISLDTNNNRLMIRGWRQQSCLDLITTMKQLEQIGVVAIIYTDVSRDGTLTEPNYKMIDMIRKNTKMSLIIAGGISSIEQIKKLKTMGVDGVIIGKALYEGKINLKEVLKYVS